MSRHDKELLASMAIGALLSFIATRNFSKWYWESEAIKHHAAHYDATTGKWQWNTLEFTNTVCYSNINWNFHP